MSAPEGENRPTRARMIAAAVAVILTIVAAWQVIDYRTQPPPPPRPIGAPPSP